MSELLLDARAPFDFASTARFLRFTDTEAVDTFDGGRYRRALHFGARLFLLSVEPDGAGAHTRLRVELAPEQFAAPQILDEASRTVRDMFSLEHDLAGWRARLVRDSVMRRLEAEHHGLRLPRWPTLFEALVTSILLQQIATSVAIIFRRRVVERYGERLETGGETYLAFPRPEALARASVEELRALGLSNAKATCIIEVARACAAGELSSASLEREDNEGVIARLSSLRGIGRWTAEWVLMLHFGRPDVFPAADLFLRGVVVKHYNRGASMSEREIRAFAAKRWGAYQSYSALYFLAGMRAGTITLKPERVLSSKQSDAKPTHRAQRKTTDRQDET
ncbi:MAG TPA: AlkA N-terminal domain-containing protein [Pyrinomonadaceae bacterium]|jgi:DNA-3-methyladenine glycosylase II|nr:AlkA N-terminal domain-containing protein [Pyrinomonadaceae bacterium]